MSDLMLHGRALRMPPDLWSDSELDVRQRHSRYIQASDLIRKQAKRIAELESQVPKWISVEDELPDTYHSYDSYSNDLKVSDAVVTNIGAACYCDEHDFYDAPCWIAVDWDNSEAGSLIEGVTHWMPLPQPPEVSDSDNSLINKTDDWDAFGIGGDV